MIQIGGYQVQTGIINGGAEKLIDLKAFYTFKEIKEGLAKKLTRAGEFTPGTQIIIDVGRRSLNNKQFQEIEDLLLDYGVHLKKIIAQQCNDLEERSVLVERMPYYTDTIMMSCHLRAGQRVFHKGNIAILGDINPGAEVIAGGNIMIMGSLKGIAHCGYYGDESTIIAAYRLKPTQLRIADHVTRPPEGENENVQEPELARIKLGKVVIEKLKN
ncbi:MAG: septum site-determining protein MinC [Syntrophomonadaceae bacterium]|jgi:septum site-determining protein MinC|nr:septum site-determining protein MinC [Syntrophomonadaceae bacterium]